MLERNEFLCLFHSVRTVHTQGAHTEFVVNFYYRNSNKMTASLTPRLVRLSSRRHCPFELGSCFFTRLNRTSHDYRVMPVTAFQNVAETMKDEGADHIHSVRTKWSHD